MSIYYPPGRYRGRVVGQAMTMTKKEEPQFVLTFDLVGLYDPSQPEALAAVNPGQRSVFRVINQNTIDYMIQDLQYLGFDKASFGLLDPSVDGHHSFIGREIDALCSHEEYEGAQREKWQLSRGGGGMNLKPADNTAMRKLDALFGAKLKANAAPTKKSAASQQNANAKAEQPQEEAIPF